MSTFKRMIDSYRRAHHEPERHLERGAAGAGMLGLKALAAAARQPVLVRASLVGPHRLRFRRGLPPGASMDRGPPAAIAHTDLSGLGGFGSSCRCRRPAHGGGGRLEPVLTYETEKPT